MTSKKQAAFLEMIAKSKKPVKKAFGGVEDVKKMKVGGEVDRKSTNTKNVNNSKSRQVERDRARFKGQSASTPTEKAPLRYGLKDMPTEKAPLRYGLKDMPTEKAPLRYGLKDMPNSASKKMAEGMERSGKEVNKIPGVKAASSEVLGSGSALRGAGRLLGKAAGPAALMLEPSELGDSDIKGGETKWSGFDDTSSDVTRAKSRASNREAMYGTQTSKPADAAKPAEAVVAVKKSDSKSMAAPVKKPSPRETSKGGRYSMADDWNAFSKGREADTAALKADTDRYGKTGTLVERSADDTAELAALKPEDFKKGGMTKRPPARPAKKVPARKFASGGTTRSSTSHRGDGCATKGHTKGRVR